MAYGNRYQLPEIAHPDPAMHYRWLDVAPDRLSQALVPHGKRPGYKIVKGPTLKDTKQIAEKLFGEGGGEMVNEVTNRIQFGNLVLGQIPKAEAARRRAELKNDLHDRLRSQNDEFQDRTARRGIKPFIAEEGEIADRKEFAERDGGGRVSLAGLEVPGTKKKAEKAAD